VDTRGSGNSGRAGYRLGSTFITFEVKKEEVNSVIEVSLGGGGT